MDLRDVVNILSIATFMLPVTNEYRKSVWGLQCIAEIFRVFWNKKELRWWVWQGAW
jgi:hypothetical protein